VTVHFHSIVSPTANVFNNVYYHAKHYLSAPALPLKQKCERDVLSRHSCGTQSEKALSVLELLDVEISLLLRVLLNLMLCVINGNE